MSVPTAQGDDTHLMARVPSLTATPPEDKNKEDGEGGGGG